jgi:hypothetical protein
MKPWMSKQSLPLILVAGLITWAWISLFSVLIGSFF